MEKFSIVEKVNVNKLNENIAAFIHKYNYEPYIFTSKDTIEALTKPIEQDSKFISTVTGIDSSFKSCLIGKYSGYKLFEDNTKNFGEIELR